MDKAGYKVAVASGDGIVINRHFGKAEMFYIYETAQNGKYRLLEKRNVTPVCNGGNHDDRLLMDNIAKLKDCKYVLTARIGAGAASALERSGITPMELPDMIEESLDKLNTYEQLQNLF